MALFTSPFESIRKGPVYQVMTGDYAAAGKRFKAISDDVPRIAGLGMRTMWLTGVTTCAGFGCTPFGLYDPMSIEPAYGTEAELRQLIDKANASGMLVIADFIGNHLSKCSPLVQYNKDLFLWDNGVPLSASDCVKGGWRFEDVAQLNYFNPEVKDLVLAMAFKLMSWGFNGLRIDAPCALLKDRMIENWGEDQPEKIAILNELYREDLLKMVIDAVRERYPGAPMIAEAMGLHKQVLKCGADLVYDFSLVDQFYRLLCEGSTQANNLVRAINEKADDYEMTSHELRFKDGHDVRSVMAAGKGLGVPSNFDSTVNRLFAVIMSTLPGVPMFYNGELEAVRGYSFNPFSNTQINWDTYDPDMRSFYMALCKMLRPIDTFRSGEAGGLGDPSSNIAAFWRADDQRTYIVAANLNPSSYFCGERQSLNITHLLTSGSANYRINNIFGAFPRYEASRLVSSSILAGEGLEVALEPKEVQVYELVPEE